METSRRFLPDSQTSPKNLRDVFFLSVFRAFIRIRRNTRRPQIHLRAPACSPRYPSFANHDLARRLTYARRPRETRAGSPLPYAYSFSHSVTVLSPHAPRPSLCPYLHKSHRSGQISY
jgi:hypothetical protein